MANDITRCDSRRAFLKMSGLAGAAGVTGLAGCLGDDDAPDDAEPVGEVELLTLAESVDPFRFEYGNWVQDELQEVMGLEVELNAAESAEYGDAVSAAENPWDLVVRRSGNEFDPLNTMVRQFFHSDYGDGGLNWWNYSNPELDELLDEQQVVEEEERIQLSHQINEMLVEDMAAVPLFNQIRAMPINEERYDNWVDQVEHGLGTFFNFLRMEPTDEEYSTLTATNIEEVHSLNPFDDFGRFPRMLTTLIYDKLAQVDPEQDNEWVPWAAETIEFSDDLDEIELVLQEGMEFHDGEEVTTADVEFTVERAIEQAPQVGNRWADLDEFEIHDDYAMTIHLDRPTAELMPWDAFDWTFIVPQHIWEDVDDVLDHEPDPPVGSGPFEITEWARGEQVELEAVDDYHREDGPNIDGIVHYDTADLRSAVDTVRAGEASQMENELSVDDVERFEEEHDEIAISEVVMISNHWIGFDHTEDHSPFAGDEEERLALRRAAAHAIPKEAISDAVYGGLAEINHQHISVEFEEWQSPDVEPQEHDPDRAEQILEEAGFDWDGDGRLYWPEDFDA